MSIHTFSTRATEPIEFGGDPALATSHLPSPGRALTATEAQEIGAICDIGARVDGSKPLVNNIW